MCTHIGGNVINALSSSLLYFHFAFQILMNVQHLSTTAALMLRARITRDRTAVHANLDILAMDILAEVYFIHFKCFLLLN